jgi:hypothetical protein
MGFEKDTFPARRALPVAVLAAGGLLVTGCIGGSDKPEPSPSSSERLNQTGFECPYSPSSPAAENAPSPFHIVTTCLSSEDVPVTMFQEPAKDSQQVGFLETDQLVDVMCEVSGGEKQYAYGDSHGTQTWLKVRSQGDYPITGFVPDVAFGFVEGYPSCPAID